jgi:hypothetical protein
MRDFDLFYEEKGRFAAQPLPDEPVMRRALEAEASAGEFWLRFGGFALVIVAFFGLVCWSHQHGYNAGSGLLCGAALALLFGVLKLLHRRRAARLRDVTDLGAEFRRYRWRLANELEFAIMTGGTALIITVAMVLAQRTDADLAALERELAVAFGAFAIGDLLVIERLRRLMRRSRA